MKRQAIIVTGSSSGIGAALAQRLAGKSSDLLLHARSSGDTLSEVASEVASRGTNVETVLGDLTCEGTASELVARAVEKFGRLDCVVANAGFPSLKSLEEGSRSDIEHAFRGNLFSFFELAMAAAPHLARSEHPRIVAVGSFTSHVFRQDIRQFPISAASKGALETAVRSLAAQFSAKRITVNCVVPGFIRKQAGTRDGLQNAEVHDTASKIPLGRFGEPDEVAAAIEFLIGADASYITGQMLHVNGGLI